MAKPSVIGLYGYSNSGKTTLIEQLILEFKTRGKKIAVIKQSGHEISMDSPGKDTQRFSQSGADPVILASVSETDIKIHKPLGISEITKIIADVQYVDIILVESARDKEIKKIRIGDIELRENTIWTYDGNFDELIDRILNGGD